MDKGNMFNQMLSKNEDEGNKQVPKKDNKQNNKKQKNKDKQVKQNQSTNKDEQKSINDVHNRYGVLSWSATVDIKVLSVLNGLKSEYRLHNISQAIKLLYTSNLKSLINRGDKERFDLTRKTFLMNKVPKAQAHYRKFYIHQKNKRAGR